MENQNLEEPLLSHNPVSPSSSHQIIQNASSASSILPLSTGVEDPHTREVEKVEFTLENLASALTQNLASNISQNLALAISQNLSLAIPQHVASVDPVSPVSASQEIVVRVIHENRFNNAEIADAAMKEISTATPIIHLPPGAALIYPNISESQKALFREFEKGNLTLSAIKYYYQLTEMNLPTKEWLHPFSGKLGLSDSQSRDIMNCIMVYVERGAREITPLSTVELDVLPSSYPSVDQVLKYQLKKNFWSRARYLVGFIGSGFVGIFYLAAPKYLGDSTAPAPSPI